jgi:prepilin-type processing-associated H-X9-DG protein
MYCSKCGAENAEGLQLCSACGWALASQLAEQEPDAKTSGLAITALVLGILSIFTFFLTALPAIIFGIVALVKIGKSSGKLKGIGLAIGGIATPAAALPIVAIMLAILMPALSRVKVLAEQTVCATNMKGLAIATMVYANDYEDKLPTADKWCDLLIEKADVSEKSFYCHNQPEGSFSYALNKNITSLNVEPDTVLIFESDGGRNAAGGPEMLASQRHKGGGCNVVFVDGHVEFVKTEDIGSLKWVPEATKDN